MKVLLTATVQSHICQFHRPLVALLHEHGCEVHVAARDNLAEKNGLKLDFVDKVYNVPFSRSPKSTDNIKAYKELKIIIDSEHYDVIHCNTPMGGIVTRLAARKARKNGTQVYYTAHGFHFYKGASKKNWMIFYPIEKIFSRITDKLITITNEDYQLACKKFHCEVFRIHGVGANSSKFYVMSDKEKKSLRQELGVEDEVKVILNIGELLPNKNQETAIAAMEEVVKQIPNSKLFIAGNGPKKDNLEQMIREKHLEKHVTLLGYTTEINKYLNICDVLIACSFREGLPLNLMEAMLCGKPIVASNNRGHRELIRDGVNGFLVNAIDVDTFARRIYDVLTKDENYEEIAINAVKFFTDVSVQGELKNIYNLENGNEK